MNYREFIKSVNKEALSSCDDRFKPVAITTRAGDKFLPIVRYVDVERSESGTMFTDIYLVDDHPVGVTFFDDGNELKIIEATEYKARIETIYVKAT